MAVIVDAMGGDHAPKEIVLGSIQAARSFGHEIVLVGDASAIKGSLDGQSWEKAIQGLKITVHDTPESISMEEKHPAQSLRKKSHASIRVAASLVKNNPKAALVSAGNTGAVLASALIEMGRMPGIERPGIAAVLPTLGDPVVVIDVGANVDCKPMNILNFAQMGLAYSRHVLGASEPKVGLLNIGSEPSKGCGLTQQTYALLSESDVPFVGNVEPERLFEGAVSVVVTDGFAGNIFLKTCEAVIKGLKLLLKQSHIGKLANLVSQTGLLERFSLLNPDNPRYAGAPLLGVEGACIVAHGASRAETIRNAINLAQILALSDTLDTIRRKTAERSS